VIIYMPTLISNLCSTTHIPRNTTSINICRLRSINREQVVSCRVIESHLGLLACSIFTMSKSIEDDVTRPLISKNHGDLKNLRNRKGTKKIFILVLIAALSAFGMAFILSVRSKAPNLSAAHLENEAWEMLKDHVSLLSVREVDRKEFLHRQALLAAELRKAGIDAFVAEPSASTTYYANISTSYELSERPFLVIFDKDGNFSYLAPKFELGRIAALEMVFEEKRVIEWREEESPYEVLKAKTGYGKVMVDEHARFMIAAGLQNAGIEVLSTSFAIQSLRSVKSEAELAILRGINQFTLQLVRALQRSIQVGISQDSIATAAKGLFTRAGVGKGFWAIVLFGEHAANPHGGSAGKPLADGEFVLIDIGSNLHEYGSDVTRTILPSKSTVSDELLGVWNTVHAAQSAAFKLMRPNETCSAVDGASRDVIIEAGFGEYFTHRLGHGLGLEMHEHPYLNGANGEKLKLGEIATNEPVRFFLYILRKPI
jgi:Xaa-Pro aminopeptidase